MINLAHVVQVYTRGCHAIDLVNNLFTRDQYTKLTSVPHQELNFEIRLSALKYSSAGDEVNLSTVNLACAKAGVLYQMPPLRGQV